MKTLSISGIFCFIFITSIGQNLSAYTDYKGCFFAYDDGSTPQLEYLPVKSFKVGGNSIAYVDNAETFKAYYGGKSKTLLEMIPQFYYDTDDLLVYGVYHQLFVFDNNTTTPLCYSTGTYSAGDSIVAFVDTNASILKVYYNGEVKELETTISPIRRMQTGDNILAYVDGDDHFKIFYHGDVFKKEDFHPLSCQAGNSIVSYVDGSSQQFKIFYAGTDYVIDNLKPQSYKTGDDMVAFINSSGAFKVFYKGTTVDISTYQPDFYAVEDNILIYGNATEFKVFYKGKITLIESYTPDNYKIDFNTLAYVDRYGYLKAFANGELSQVDTEKISDFLLTRNIIQYSNSMGEIKFFPN